MNALLERFSRQQLAQRQFDGERLMDEFLHPATCSVCGQPKLPVVVAEIDDYRASDRICQDCGNEVAQYSSRYNVPIHRAIYDIRNMRCGNDSRTDTL